MLNLRGVHVVEKVPNKNEYRLKEIHPVVRLSSGEEVVFIQDGTVYDAGGNVLEEDTRPGWFISEVGKMTPTALREVGFRIVKKG